MKLILFAKAERFVDNGPLILYTVPMNEKIAIGMELVINGQHCIVDEIDWILKNIAWAVDDFGCDVQIPLDTNGCARMDQVVFWN